MTRRNFLVTLGLTGVATATAEATGAIEKFTSWIDTQEQKKLQEKIEKKNEELKTKIAKGIEEATWTNSAVQIYNEKLAILKTTNKDALEYASLIKEMNAIKDRLNDLEMKRGPESCPLFSEANKYAESLLTNDKALTVLAAATVIFKEKTGGDIRGVELPYWHNLVLAYEELERFTVEEITAKITAFCDKYKDENWHNIPFEKIVYFLIDANFKIDLEPEQLKRELDRLQPGWDQFSATHANKDTYTSYNDLTKLDIFERNRLRTVAIQLHSEEFRKAVFSVRDADLENLQTEYGGVVPLESQGHKPLVMPADKNISDHSYIPSTEAHLREFAGAAGFHCHADQISVPKEIQGPSGGDDNYFVPGVVFSSINKNTLLAHFSVGRGKRLVNYTPQMAVVCLGEIKQ